MRPENYIETEESVMSSVNEGRRFNENEALFAQKVATEHAGKKFSEQTGEKSMDFASELIGDLRVAGLNLDGLDWEAVKASNGPTEVIVVLKEYAKSRGVDIGKIDEYMKDTKNEPVDFSYAKKVAILVSFLAVLGAGETPSEAHADPLVNQSHVREYTKEEIKDTEEMSSEMRWVVYLGDQEQFQDYFNSLKKKYPIRDISISEVSVAKKVVEEKRQDRTFDERYYKVMVPAVVVGVRLEVVAKDGRRIMLEDKSYRNINKGTPADSGSLPYFNPLEYAVKKGWFSPRTITTVARGGWNSSEWVGRYKDKLIDETVHRIGDDLLENRLYQ